MHARAEIFMRQVHEPKRLKIEAKLHYFVTILEQKVNTQLLI